MDEVKFGSQFDLSPGTFLLGRLRATSGPGLHLQGLYLAAVYGQKDLRLVVFRLVARYLLRRQGAEGVLAQSAHKERAEDPAVSALHTPVEGHFEPDALIVAHQGNRFLKGVTGGDRPAHRRLHFGQAVDLLFIGGPFQAPP